jgi:hypothetical protein
MRSPAHRSSRQSKFVSGLALLPFVFAAQLLVAGVLLASGAAAQAPDAALQPPEAPPPPAVFQNLIPSDQLAFLNDYNGKMEKDLLKDKRFRALMKLVTPGTRYFYGGDMPLAEASSDVLDTEPLPVDIRDGRYAMIGTHGGGFHGGRGFMWFDMKEGIGLGGMYFHPGNGEPTPTLAIFSRQLKDTALSISQLPPAFVEDLSQWALVVGLPAITTRYFIPGNGRKYVLAHDEDYCSHPGDAPPPDEERCEKMNADAAGIDLDAADFMAKTGNAPDATAWMLGPWQVDFIATLNRSCGVGPNQWQCRARLTRQRVRVVLQQQRK